MFIVGSYCLLLMIMSLYLSIVKQPQLFILLRWFILHLWSAEIRWEITTKLLSGQKMYTSFTVTEAALLRH